MKAQRAADAKKLEAEKAKIAEEKEKEIEAAKNATEA